MGLNPDNPGNPNADDPDRTEVERAEVERTEVDPTDVDGLLAAWALGALDDDLERTFDSRLGVDADLRRQADELRRAVASLDELLATAPPAGLRDRLLGEARARPAQLVEPAAPGELFARQVEALSALLDELGGEDWARRAEPYDWTVHGLVAHLLVIERYTAGQLGLGAPLPVPDGAPTPGHLELGADAIRDELARPPAGTARRWRDQARATADALAARAASLPAAASLHGWPFSLEGLVIARSFELWTHADDIRRATGRQTVAPLPADLRAMSSFSVTALPLTLPLVDPARPLGPTRVVLTGAGGGTFDLPAGPAIASDASEAADVGRAGRAALADEHTLLVADVVDYCRVVARRISPDELRCSVEGDEALARALLVSASVFAV